jgi:hypothetical protein
VPGVWVLFFSEILFEYVATFLFARKLSYVLNFGGSSRGFPCHIRVPPFRGFVPVSGRKPVLRASTALMDLVLIVKVSTSHSDTPHSLGHLLRSDRPVAETST